MADNANQNSRLEINELDGMGLNDFARQVLEIQRQMQQYGGIPPQLGFNYAQADPAQINQMMQGVGQDLRTYYGPNGTNMDQYYANQLQQAGDKGYPPEYQAQYANWLEQLYADRAARYGF